MDYATKQWSGVVSDYFLKRWKLFFGHLMSDLDGITTFDEKAFKEDFINKIGKPFCQKERSYPTEPTGSPIAVAKVLYRKWRADMDP